MVLGEILHGNGGWLHRADLIDRGWSAHRIRRAQASEGVVLLRRRWLLAPGAPADIAHAAGAGGVVTCMSAIRRYGLWLPPDVEADTPHIGLAPNATASSAGVIAHRARPVVPRPERELVDPIENVLALVARCMPAERAFAVWESAVTAGLVTPTYLRSLPWTSQRARELAHKVTALSDSGVESTFVWRCRRAGIAVVQQVRIAGHRVDALIGRRLVVQLDGFAFHRDAAQRRRDIRHDRELTALGFTVLRFDYYDVVHDWKRVERELRRAIALGLAD